MEKGWNRHSFTRLNPVSSWREFCEPIDILIGGTWLKGRVEYSHNDVGRYTGWYFATDDGWCPLVAGMRVRRV